MANEYILTPEGKEKLEKELGMVEARIAEINQILSEATVVAAPKRSSRVNVGSTVVVNMGGRERTFTIVGAAEADVASGKISNESPVGAALLGHKKDDVITATGPTGREVEMTIVKIEQEQPDRFCIVASQPLSRLPLRGRHGRTAGSCRICDNAPPILKARRYTLESH